MLKDITLGQYFPGDSIIHRTDPRIKIILSMIYITTLFLAKNLYGFLAIALSAILLVALSKIKLSVILKGVKPILIILIFTTLMNLFLTKGEGEALFQWRFLKIYESGIINAVFMIIRIISLIIGTSIFLTYTTTPDTITDALERLLSPLKKIKVPVHEFSMMMMLALRFIPPLIEETDKIMSAQKARGASFESGGLVAKARGVIPIIIPLIISSFRRAGELATAMECRCYNGGAGRTRMKSMHMKARDFGVLAVCLAFMAAIILMNGIYCSFRLA